MWSLTLGLSILVSSVLGEMELRILRPDGRALQNAKVHARSVDPALAEDRWVVGHTDAEGRVRLELDPGFAIDLAVKHWIYDMITLELQPPRERFVQVRLPEPPWSLVDVPGRVVSAKGAPVTGANLEMRLATSATARRRWTARTDGDGRFEMHEVPEGAYRVELRAPGQPITVERAAILRGMPPLELRFSPLVLVRGRLVGDVELESSTTHVAVSAASSSWLSHTDPCKAGGPVLLDGPDGFFQQERGLVSGDHYEIRLPLGSWTVRASGWSSTESLESRELWSANAEIHLEGEVTERELDLVAREPCEELKPNETAPLRGRVYDEATDSPVPQVWVLAGCRRTITGADGDFELPVWDDPEGCFSGLKGLGDIWVQPPEGWAWRRVPFPPAGVESIEVPIRKVVGLCYQLSWADGEPFPHSVEIFEPGNQEQLARGDTDADGAGCVANLPAGDFELEPMYQGGWRIPFSIPAEPLFLTVPLTGSLRIRAPELTRDFGLRTPEGTLLRLDPLSGASSAPIVRRTSPTLWVGGVPPGRWRVTVRAPDGREWRADAVIVARESVTVVVR